MQREIPGAVLAVCADILSSRLTHATLDSLFTYAGAPGEPPEGSKHAKALEWLRRTNRDPAAEPIKVLGRLLDSFMDLPVEALTAWDEHLPAQKEKIRLVLAEAKLQYAGNGVVVSSLGTPTRALSEFIRDKDFGAIDAEFQRALEHVEKDPREAVSAASNILESVCKVMIADEGLESPSKQDLLSVWGPVRKHLGLDPSLLEEQDLQKILTGIISIVQGIGALRTHASSAHGAGRKTYKLEPRHARLAIHSAHTLALFVLESWQKRQPAKFARMAPADF